MKRFFLFSLVVVFLLAPTSAMAVEPDNLGRASFKAGWLTFTDDFLEDTESDGALYIAIEARSRLTDYLDVGMELGYARLEGDIGDPGGRDVSGIPTPFIGGIENEITYIPIEVNLSHTKDLGILAYTLGAGYSLNYINWDIRFNDTGNSFLLLDEEDQWAHGYQAFFDFSFESEGYFAGFDGKYQYVDETDFFNDLLEVNLHNWRTNIQIGRFF